ncbi:translation initiation inhibitor [Saccharopolyspora subtropica]|uniref:RidA family protein n=1 Tax=Saccharopolyspora thermophila TaxID=89367 RepID=A0A917NHN7_9PSEU|nr:RidA family protein [Saccharopolyspora subtropica]GGI98853.1 translation initiation inhibitor [Saccharopolyspora subtropica]
MIRRWNPETLAAPIGLYSHLSHVPADHELVVVSGQVGVLPDGSLAGEDAESQTRAVFANIERAFRAAGAGPDQLVKVFSMVAGAENLAGFRAGVREAFTRWFPGGDWPAQSLIVVSALARPEILVEVEVMIAVPR